jgi:dTDP-4-dehydrorhamnose reductase
MLVGNGLIASAFLDYKDNDDVIVIASGISNSKETDYKKYQREIDMIGSFIGTKSKVVYFSTISVFDESLDSLYVKHKRYIEKMISSNFDSYLIFRLPIVIGKTNNTNTFINNIKRKIISEETIYINNMSSIYIIDIDDIKRLLPNLIDVKNNETINVVFNNKEFVFDVIQKIEILLGKEANKKIINDGFDFTIDPLFDDKYDNNFILKKYIN